MKRRLNSSTYRDMLSFWELQHSSSYVFLTGLTISYCYTFGILWLKSWGDCQLLCASKREQWYRTNFITVYFENLICHRLDISCELDFGSGNNKLKKNLKKQLKHLENIQSLYIGLEHFWGILGELRIFFCSSLWVSWFLLRCPSLR